MSFLDTLTEINSIKYLSNSATDEFKANLSDDARERLELRQVENHAKAKQVLKALFTGVEKDHGKDGISCLQKTLVGLGLRSLLEESPALETASYVKAKDYKDFYNQAVYQNILPLCQLAYLYEKNGIPEEHAFKLATLFKDEKKIHAYLLHFKQSNPYLYLVHDACLFELPPSEACEFQRWKEIANRTQNNIPVWMLNPRFRDLLPHAPALERIERSGLDEAKQSKKILDKEVIQAKEKEIAAIRKDYKRVAGKPQVNPTEKQKEKRKKQLSELSAQKSKRRLELATLCAGMTLEEASMTVLQAFYEKYQSGSSEAHQLMVKHGISEQQIAQFNALPRRNDDQAIPNVVIDGAAIGCPGLYLKKLDTLSDKGAAIAACLGKLTNCCQYLGGAGTACVIHGITSPDGGFYVVCKGDARNPSLDDQILAQSWTWRSMRGALCCDSIEVSHTCKVEQIVDMFRYFAHVLCTKPEFEQYQVSRINTGSGSGITSDIASEAFSTTTEHPINYNGYRDSNSQLLLADAAIPYLFYGENTSPRLFRQFPSLFYGKSTPSTFQEMINQDTQHYFKSLLEVEGPLMENQPLKKIVCFLLLRSKQQEPLTLLKEVAGARQLELEQLVDVNRHYIDELNQNRIAVEALKQGAYLNAINKEGESALHLAAENPELLNVILGLLPKKQWLEVLEMTNASSNTVLHEAAQNPESLKIIFGLLTEAQRLEALEKLNESDETVLHCAARNAESLRVILELLPEAARLKAMTGLTGNIVMDAAVENPESLKVILELLPESQRLEAVKMTNIYGYSLLCAAAKHPESLKILLGVYPKAERLKAVETIDQYGQTVFHLAARNAESLKILLELYPETERRKAVETIDQFGQTVFHTAARDAESLKVLLGLYLEAEWLKILMTPDKYGKTVLHEASKNHESLNVIIDGSKICIQAVEQIINRRLEEELPRLQDLLHFNEHAELEFSLIELYKAKIYVDFIKFSSQEIPIVNLRDTRDALRTTILDALKRPNLTLKDCQILDKIVTHAITTIDPNGDQVAQFDSICELEKFSDEAIRKKSEVLAAVAAACGMLAIVAAIITLVLAPTDTIGLANGIAVAGILAVASIGSDIAAKSLKTDLAKKNRSFFKTVSEKIIDQPDEGNDLQNIGHVK